MGTMRLRPSRGHQQTGAERACQPMSFQRSVRSEPHASSGNAAAHSCLSASWREAGGCYSCSGVAGTCWSSPYSRHDGKALLNFLRACIRGRLS